MSLEGHKSFIDDHKGDQHGLNETYYKSGNFRRVTDGALAMEVGDEVVHAYAATAVVTVTLPPVKEATGKVYTIHAMDATAEVYVLDNADDSFMPGIHLNYTGQWVTLYSNGYRWKELEGNHYKRHFVEMFDHQVLTTNIGGGESQTTGTNVMYTGGPDGMTFELHVKGTQTLAPRRAAGGLDIGADQTANDGYELNPVGPLLGHGLAFTIGTDPRFYATMRFQIADVSGTDDCAFGFRLVEAYQAAIDNYNDMAVLNVISGNVTIETIVGGAATVPTDTTEDWGDGEIHTLGVDVSAAGVVTYRFDAAAPTTVAAYTFTDAIVVEPFFYYLHDATSPGAIVLQYFECGLG